MTRPSWWYHNVTPRQQYAIDIIKYHLNIDFDGQYKGQAAGFIGRYYNLAKQLMNQGVRIEQMTNQWIQETLQILKEDDPWIK